jgi:hypothetical protein
MHCLLFSHVNWFLRQFKSFLLGSNKTTTYIKYKIIFNYKYINTLYQFVFLIVFFLLSI